MRCTLRYGFLLLCLLSCRCVTAQQRTVFVGVAGNDKNTGTVSDPVKSFAEAWKRVSAGDTICVLPGTYHENIRLTGKQGSREKYIYLYGRIATNGEKPSIDGGAAVPAMELNNHWIELTNTAWIEIANLSFVNGWTDPIRVTNSSYISFIHCDFKGGRKVILGTGGETHHVLVDGCTWDQGGNALWTIDKDSRGVDAWLSMHHELMGYYNGTLVDSRATGGSFVIRNNKITNAYNGIRLTSQKGFDGNTEIYNNSLTNIRDNDFEPEHYAFNLHIYHNRSHNIHKTFSVDDVAGGYIYYYGNTVTGDGDEWARKICTGVWKIYGGEDSLSYPLYLFNNSFFVYGKAFNAMEKKSLQIKHYNNAYFFAGPESWVLQYVDPTNDFDYDMSNTPWPASIQLRNLEQHGIIGNVDYLNQKQFDLRLRSGSAAIDAGKIMHFPELNWEQTFKGKAPDIGAYEGKELVDGPPFRYREQPGAQYHYKETPRIVRYRLENKKLFLYFSDAIDAGTVSALSTVLHSKGLRIAIASMYFPRDRYELVIETKTALDAKTLSLGFIHPPLGVNGMPVTSWASAIPYYYTY